MLIALPHHMENPSTFSDFKLFPVTYLPDRFNICLFERGFPVIIAFHYLMEFIFQTGFLLVVIIL